MEQSTTVDLLILGSGTAATNAARQALQEGATDVRIIQPPTLTNTCVEEGCMPSKSVLAGAHAGESLATIETTRNAHIDRLRSALTEGFVDSGFTIIEGTARFVSAHEVAVTEPDQTETILTAKSILIATGSEPFVPSIPGIDVTHDRILLSDEVVSERAHFPATPASVLVIGAGPIGLELATFFHDLGATVEVLNRTNVLLPAMDPECGAERYRASQAEGSFPIHLNATVTHVTPHERGVTCQVMIDGETHEREYEYVLVATGRRPRIDALNLGAADVQCDKRGGIIHDDTMRTSVPHIFVAGDVTGHHQILHFAAEMGKVAGANAIKGGNVQMEYDRHQLAVSFDQYPSAFIGLTETEAVARGIDVRTATKHFRCIGLGILKRQEYGFWKLVVAADTGEVLGAQVIGPSEAGELVQFLVPVLYNKNTAADILRMTWYHPTYAEILHSLARDICQQETVHCPGV